MTSNFSARDGASMSKKNSERKSIGMAYFTFALIASAVMRLFSDCEFSAILTLGVAVQCLGFAILYQKVQRQKSVAGVSKKTLELYRVVFVVRLMCTCTHGGYIPVDRSGDWVYQVVDMASLYIVHSLLKMVETTHRSTYQEEYDTMNTMKALPICFILGIWIHGDLNDSFIFDSLWQASTNLETIAMVPQLWMLANMGGEVDMMTGHFVVSIMVSRACSLAFWGYAFREVRSGRGWNIAGWKLLSCHVTQLLLSADFLYYYLKGAVMGRRLVLPSSISI